MSSSKKRKKTDLSPRAIGVAEIPTDQLHANPHNPRMLFDQEPLDVLQESVRRVGILVPLTVYREKKTGRYVILDGQRRWIVAQRLNLPKVPVNEVEEPSLVQNIVTMFQIHKLREDWDLMPTALKVEVLMKELSERGEKKLAVLTGLDQTVVTRYKKLLDYPRRYQDLMLDPDPQKRIRADFFIELYAVRNDRFVNSLDWYARDAFTDAMLARYLRGHGIKAVTDFRIIKQHINNARRAGLEDEISTRLRDFTEDPSKPIDFLNIRSADVSAHARKLETTVSSLTATLRDLDVREYYGEEGLWSLLEKLYKMIGRKLRDAQRRIPNA